jgi:hypothetical protein
MEMLSINICKIGRTRFHSTALTPVPLPIPGWRRERQRFRFESKCVRASLRRGDGQVLVASPAGWTSINSGLSRGCTSTFQAARPAPSRGRKCRDGAKWRPSYSLKSPDFGESRAASRGLDSRIWIQKPRSQRPFAEMKVACYRC